MKAQGIRVVDVFVIAPLCAWAAVELREKYPIRAAAVGLVAAGTFAYNYNNFVERAELDEIIRESSRE